MDFFLKKRIKHVKNKRKHDMQRKYMENKRKIMETRIEEEKMLKLTVK